MSRLFTLGEVLAVLLVDDGLPLAEARQFRRTTAGSESNVAAGFVRLGHNATLVTRVGYDALGDAVAAALAGWHIDARVGRSTRPTGTLVRSLGGQFGVEAVHLRDNAAGMDISPADVDAAWGPGADVVFVTGISAVRSESARLAVEHTVELAVAAGALVVVDPNIRERLGTVDDYRDALRGIRSHTGVAIGDLTELAVLAGTTEDDAVRALLDYGARLVVTKRGAEGAVATDGTDTWEVSSQATTVVDTVGAGDAFAAGLIAGVVEGKSVPEAMHLASHVAARVVATAGDVEGFPARSHIDKEASR